VLRNNRDFFYASWWYNFNNEKPHRMNRLSPSFAKINLITSFAVAAGIGLLLALTSLLVSDQLINSMVNIALHSGIEVFGGVAALRIASVLRALEKNGRGGSFNNLIAAALISMGLWSLVHGLLPDGASFTDTTVGLNTLGAIALAVTAVKLIVIYRKTRNTIDLGFTLQCILLSGAALIFAHSTLWHLDWWISHFMRLGAFGFGLWFLSAHKTKLELDERQKTLETLDITERRFALAVEGSGDGVWDVDIPNRKMELSARWKGILGYNTNELSGSVDEWMSFVHPDDLDGVLKNIYAHYEQKAPNTSAEYRVRTKNGDYIWVLARGLVVARGSDGKPLRMVGTHSDITAQKVATEILENALRDNANLLNALNAHAIVSIADSTGIITDVNQAFCRISGYNRTELVGKNHRIVNSGTHSRDFWKAMWNDIANGKPWRGTLCNRAKNGTYYWVDTFIAPYTNTDGSIQKYISIRTDVTVAKEQEAALLSKTNQLQKAADVAELGIWTWDLIDESFTFNERMHDIYETPDYLRKSGLLYDYWRARVHPDDIQFTQDKLHGAIAGQTTYDPVFRIIKKNGSVSHIQAGAYVERNTSGKATMMMGINRDITQQVQLEETLRNAKQAADEANRAKSEFLANMSHEIRTPMNAVLGMLALLRKTELNSRQEDYAQKSENAAKSLLGLLNDILDVSKAEAGKIDLDPQPFFIDVLIKDISVILLATRSNKPIEIIFDIDANIPHHLVGDAMRLQQVLINLGSNAVKFTEAGEVVVTVKAAEVSDKITKLYFSVKDSGIGIAPENQARIFSGFTQAEASTTRRFGGTGLGVAISQKLVALMGGKLELKSALGEGSEFYFTITLPIADKSTDEVSSPLSRKALRLQGARILLVEDNIYNQQIAIELLEAEGAILEIANNGQEAVDILRRRSDDVDLVLMDLQMPVLDGITATKIIRQELSLSTLPIVAMTANAMAADRQECLGAGMNEHIGKPFDLHHLVAVIAKLINPDQFSLENPTTMLTKPSENANDYALAMGIDLKGAVNRFGGNSDLYLRMLPKFLDNLIAMPEQLRAYLSQNELKPASRILHTLKGLAATMGATTLSAESAKNEKLMENQSSLEEATVIVDQMCVSIEITLSCLKKLSIMMQQEKSDQAIADKKTKN
jgi:PAS domain S-box-containing protein